MRFEVPQFIDIEDKIFGPFTFKQFVYMAGGAGVGVIAFTTLPQMLAIMVAAPIVGLAMALAFFKYNKRPFIVLLESIFYFYSKNNRYKWQKIDKPVTDQVEDMAEQIANPTFVPKLSDSKLKDLSWSLDLASRDPREVL